MSDVPVPRWAERARGAVRSVVVVYAVYWLVRGALELSDHVFDTNLYSGDGPTWLRVVILSLFVVWIVCGLVWLAGAAVTGYREQPREK